MFRASPGFRASSSPSKSDSGSAFITLKLPVIVSVLAAIAVPVELRPLGGATFGFEIQAFHFLENIAGFVLLGWVLGEWGFLRAVLTGAVISASAEVGQLIMMNRDPALDDIIANVIGAVIGAAISAKWKIHPPRLRVRKWLALAALAAAAGLVVVTWPSSFNPANPRGVSSPGILEAYWKFDEPAGHLLNPV